MIVKLKLVRLAALIVCASFLLSGCACAAIPYLLLSEPAPSKTALPERDAFYDAEITEPREGIAFRDLRYERPDTEKIAGKAALCETLMKLPDPGPMLTAYDELLTLYLTAETQITLADILYSLDISEEYYSDEYSWLLDEMTGLDLMISDLTIAILESEHQESAEAAWGSAFIERAYQNAALNDESVENLFIKEQELIFKYDELRTDTTVSYEGRAYTIDDLYSDRSLDYAVYIDLYSAYCEKLNKSAGPLFMEMTKLRAEISDKLDFDNYSDYAYACFGRDYSPQDAKKVHAAVKKYAVPLYAELFESLYDADSERLFSVSLDRNVIIRKFTDVAPDFSDKLAESLNYMLEYGLYDLDVRDSKLSGGFTAYLADYGSPFLFDNWDGSYLSVSGLSHELGHFNSFYHNPSTGWNSPADLDLSEVDSQGLELLFTEYYGEFYGSLSRAAINEKLQDALYAMITGCMEDEFQQAIYEDPDKSLRELNELYEKLAREYGLAEIYGTEGTEWVLIPHTFQSPLYYISYAVSMESALELWNISLGDRDRAVSLYETLLERDPDLGFTKTLERNGLSDPFNEALIKELCEAIKEYTFAESTVSGVFNQIGLSNKAG